MEGDPRGTSEQGPAAVLTFASSQAWALQQSLTARRAALELHRGLGAVETPPALARDVVAEVYRNACARPGPLPALLDPACGTGVFLLAAFDHLCERFPRKRTEELLASLHGWDVDPVAVRGARRVLTLAARRRSAAGCAGAAAVVVRQVLVDDALRERPAVARFRLVVGNPPWVALAGKHRAAVPAPELVARLGGASYRPNLFELFVRAAAAWLVPGGRLAMVVPDRLARNEQLEPLRRTLLTAWRLRRVVFVAPFPGVKADILWFRADRSPAPPGHTVQMLDTTTAPPTRCDATARALLARANCPYWFVRHRGVAPLIDRLIAWPMRLPDRVRTCTGFIAARGRIHARGAREILQGRHVRAFAIAGHARFDDGPGAIIGGTLNGVQLGARVKALVPKTGRELRCALDASGRWPEQSLYFLLAEERTALELAVVLLNSRLMRLLYRVAFTTNRSSLPHLKKIDLDQFPWPERSDGRRPHRRSWLFADGTPRVDVDTVIERAFGVTAAERRHIADAWASEVGRDR